jgi:hypothetical protein
MRVLLCCVASALLMGVTASVGARENRPPERIAVDGGEPLPLWGWAHRTHLLGTIDLYTVALYGGGGGDYARLAAVDAAKALRIEVTHQNDLSRRPAFDWRPELVPPLEPHAVAHLRGSFAPLRRGDVVQIEYVPSKGTTVRVNRGVAVSAAHHDLMLAFLDHWLGQHPVSDEMRRKLLGVS